jgi:hypothetical protein
MDSKDLEVRPWHGGAWANLKARPNNLYPSFVGFKQSIFSGEVESMNKLPKIDISNTVHEKYGIAHTVHKTSACYDPKECPGCMTPLRYGFYAFRVRHGVPLSIRSWSRRMVREWRGLIFEQSEKKR